MKLKCPDASKAIFCASDCGPIFGSGSAFQISNNSNNKENFSLLGITSCIYKHPYYPDNSFEAKSFLGGSIKFKVLEMETYFLE